MKLAEQIEQTELEISELVKKLSWLKDQDKHQDFVQKFSAIQKMVIDLIEYYQGEYYGSINENKIKEKLKFEGRLSCLYEVKKEIDSVSSFYKNVVSGAKESFEEIRSFIQCKVKIEEEYFWIGNIQETIVFNFKYEKHLMYIELNEFVLSC